MKATLLALLTLGSLAMAAEEPQEVTLASYSGNSTSETISPSNGNFDNVVLTLSNEPERYWNLSGTPLTSTVTLTNISIAAHSAGTGTTITDKYLILTEASGDIVAFSTAPGAVASLNGKNAWGDNGLDFTRNFTTWSDFMDFNNLGNESISLSLDTPYYVFFATSDQIVDVQDYALDKAAGQEVPDNVFEMTPAVNTTVRLTTLGNYDADSVTESGLMKAKQIPSNAVAPYMSVTVQNNNVPEPTTGTLSLLALAGLCIRRRK